jgi:hypothetical protein
MTISNFQPKIWSGNILYTLQKSLVYAGAPCSNTDYEGEISAFGSSVQIEAISDPTITAYSKDTDLSAPEALTDSAQILTIDQANSFNFAVDDIDKAQVRNDGGLMAEATKRAAFGLRDKADQLVALRMVASAGTSLGVVDASSTATNVYDQVLVPASVALDQANVPEELRWIVLPPAVYGKLQLDSRFIKQNESGNDALHNGNVGQAAGFQIYKSNNAPVAPTHSITDAAGTSGASTITSATKLFRQSDIGLKPTGTGVGTNAVITAVSSDGGTATVSVVNSATINTAVTIPAGADKQIVAGSSLAHTFAQQILEIEAYRPEKRFGDALKGLHVFGTKVVRPAALVIAGVKTS